MERYSAKNHLAKIEELIDTIGTEKESIIFVLLFEFLEKGGKKFKEKNKTIFSLLEKKIKNMGYEGSEKKLKKFEEFFSAE